MPHAHLKGPPTPPQSRCTKLPFESRGAAKAHLRKWGVREPDRSLVQSTMGLLTVYRCRWCRMWHFGHLPVARKKETVMYLNPAPGSHDPATGEKYQPDFSPELNNKDRRLLELKAEHEAKAYDQFYEEFPEERPTSGDATGNGGAEGGVGNPIGESFEQPAGDQNHVEEHHE